MQCFILKRQPKSYNSWKSATTAKKIKYKTDIQNAFKEFYPTHTTHADDLYGLLYYLFKKDLNSDADNLSKPLWDCLTGFLFEDDKQIKIRTAGSFDLSKNDINVLDFSGLAGDIIIELLEAFDNEEHVVYVECGILNNSMFKFNMEK